MGSSQTYPETYDLALYYTVNPWSAQLNEQNSVLLNAKIIGVPKGRNAYRLRVDLIQVTPVNTPVAKPKDKATRRYFIETISRMLEEHTGRTIDTIRWSVVDFMEKE